MLYNMSLTLTRRVVLFPLVSRAGLTRSISSSPAATFPAKSEAKSTTKPTKTTTKRTTKSTATKTTDKPKKVVEKKKEKKVKYTRAELTIPPRPIINSYLVFANEERSRMPKPETLAASRAQIKEIGQKWQTLTEDQKKAYEARSAEEKEKKAKGYNEWLENLDPKVLREINARRRASGLPKVVGPRDGPKRPQSAFLHFLHKFRAENPSLALLETSRQGGVAWRALSQEEKQPYLEKANAGRKAYLAELEAHNATQQSV